MQRRRVSRRVYACNIFVTMGWHHREAWERGSREQPESNMNWTPSWARLRYRVVLALSVFLTALAAWGQAINATESSVAVAGQLPARYQVIFTEDALVVDLTGIGPGSVRGIWFGNELRMLSDLGVTGAEEGEFGAWSRVLLPRDHPGETVDIELTNRALVMLGKPGAETAMRSSEDTSKAGLAPQITVSMSSSRVFPTGIATVTVGVIGGLPSDNVTLAPTAVTTGIAISKVSSNTFLVTGKAVGTYSLVARVNRGVSVVTSSNSLPFFVRSPEGWSSATGYKYPSPGTVERDILNAANAMVPALDRQRGETKKVGNLAPLSRTVSSFADCTTCAWDVDTAIGKDPSGRDEAISDGTAIVNAFRIKNSWNPKLPTAQRDAQMSVALAANYTSSNDRAKLVARINATQAMPTDASTSVLNSLGIRAQCAEFVQRLAYNARAASARGVQSGSGSTEARPGYSLRSASHSAVLSDVKYDASGRPVDFEVIDSNFTSNWSDPTGDVPWERTVRRALIQERFGISRYEVRSHSLSSQGIGTPLY